MYIANFPGLIFITLHIVIVGSLFNLEQKSLPGGDRMPLIHPEKE